MIFSGKECGRLPVAAVLTFVNVKPSIHQLVMRNHRKQLEKCENV
jgi:hypothetical protein